MKPPYLVGKSNLAKTFRKALETPTLYNQAIYLHEGGETSFRSKDDEYNEQECILIVDNKLKKIAAPYFNKLSNRVARDIFVNLQIYDLNCMIFKSVIIRDDKQFKINYID